MVRLRTDVLAAAEPTAERGDLWAPCTEHAGVSRRACGLCRGRLPIDALADAIDEIVAIAMREGRTLCATAQTTDATAIVDALASAPSAK